MGNITKVIIAGATGMLGPPVLDQLVRDGFEVTVLTRKGGNHSFPASVKVAEVDYDSLGSLIGVLEGQDAVVSALGFGAMQQQLALIQAAIKAGVKRFIPSEFGSNIESEKSAHFPVFQGKKAAREALEKAAASSSITYTLIGTGPFLDSGIQNEFLINLREKSINLWDGGDQLFSTTTLPAVAKTVSEVLKHPNETKNRGLNVQSTAISSRKLLEIGKTVVGSDGWKLNARSIDDVLEAGYTELKKDHPEPLVRRNFIVAAIFGKDYGGHFPKVDNELLGIEEMTDAQIQNLMESFVK
ncbi:nmrA-like family protein-like protein [Whalleya microplaca]|nr:nmrA-like family protein-like protein [Whalleya microplaca]